jgi:hypothetical protein
MGDGALESVDVQIAGGDRMSMRRTTELRYWEHQVVMRWTWRSSFVARPFRDSV